MNDIPVWLPWSFAAIGFFGLVYLFVRYVEREPAEDLSEVSPLSLWVCWRCDQTLADSHWEAPDCPGCGAGMIRPVRERV